MMGFPDDFILPKSITQAMKQLGNSVCVDVIENLAYSLKSHLDKYSVLDVQKGIKMAKNKGEWSELYAFFKLLVDNKLYFGDEYSRLLSECVTVFEVAHNDSELVYGISDSDIVFKSTSGVEVKRKKVSEIISHNGIANLLNKIKHGTGRSFDIQSVIPSLEAANIYSSVKGNSFQKGDLQIAFEHKGMSYPLSPVGIKSDLGAKPTLLNASSATNFVFEVNGLTTSIDEINNINTKSKIKDRLQAIQQQGASINFVGCELDIHTKNLQKIDSLMPQIIAELLLKYYGGQGSRVSDLVIGDQVRARFKDYLKSILLGMFYTREWDGNTESVGSILIKDDGELQLYHVIKENILKDYLFNHTKLDTPSSTRHRFGSLYQENGKVLIKLNLQIRML